MFHVGNLCRPLFPRASVTFAAAATSRKLSRGLFEIPAVYIYKCCCATLLEMYFFFEKMGKRKKDKQQLPAYQFGSYSI
jgi:hypothetical protein